MIIIMFLFLLWLLQLAQSVLHLVLSMKNEKFHEAVQWEFKLPGRR